MEQQRRQAQRGDLTDYQVVMPDGDRRTLTMTQEEAAEFQRANPGVDMYKMGTEPRGAGGAGGAGRPSGNRESLINQANEIVANMDQYLFDEKNGVFSPENRGGNLTLPGTDIQGGPLAALNVIPRAVRTRLDYYGQHTEVARNLKTYLDTTKGRLAPLIKAFGDSGNISISEQETMMRAMPDPKLDTPETARKKYEDLKALLEIAKYRHENGIIVRPPAKGGASTPPTGAQSPPQAEATPLAPGESRTVNGITIRRRD
jgi:hypothetical protein